MKTTMDIDDETHRQIKIQAAKRGTSIKNIFRMSFEHFLSARSDKLSPPLLIMTVRGSDSWGSGEWQASRGGGKLHRGIDLVVSPGDEVYAPCGGTLRIGYPYNNDQTFKYIAIKGHAGEVRLMYVLPRVQEGEVKRGDAVGVAQDIRIRYSETMTPHIHMDLNINVLGSDVLVGDGLRTKKPIWINPLTEMEL